MLTEGQVGGRYEFGATLEQLADVEAHRRLSNLTCATPMSPMRIVPDLLRPTLISDAGRRGCLAAEEKPGSVWVQESADRVTEATVPNPQVSLALDARREVQLVVSGLDIVGCCQGDIARRLVGGAIVHQCVWCGSTGDSTTAASFARLACGGVVAVGTT